MPEGWLIPLLPLAAYLAGSIPFGYLIGRARGVDIRQHGSRNIGATNVGRVLGRKWGYLCFVLDVLKGLLPVLLAGHFLGPGRQPGPHFPPQLWEQALWLATAFGAIAGHIFPVWLRFRGGKGVATSLGVVLGIWPYYTIPGLCAFAIWIVTVLIWRYVSLSSIIAAVAFPLLLVAWSRPCQWSLAGLWPLAAFAVAMPILVILRHRGNIQRLRAGTENKIR